MKHLGLTAKGKGNKNMASLKEDNGMSVLLMSPSMGGDTTMGYPSTFHIGFMQDTEEQVNQIVTVHGFEVLLGETAEIC